MSSDQPYNELGQILANGGEIALGLAISRGWSSSQIALLFAQRFEPISEIDRQRLIGLANRAVVAASEINDLDDDDIIPPDMIPTNPYLFGDEPGGRRGKIAGRWQDENTGQWYDFRMDVADITDKAAMLEQANEMARDNWNKYPEGKKGGFGQGELEHITIQLILAEKRF